MEVLGGLAEQYGIFAATYAIAGIYFSQPHTQIVILGDDHAAERLYRTALASFDFGKAVVKLEIGKAVPQNLPSALGSTIPLLRSTRDRNSVAIVCSNFACLPPISDPDELARILKIRSSK